MIDSNLYYNVECDYCGADIETEHGEIALFETESDVNNAIGDNEWKIINDKHYCPECYEFDDDGEPIVKVLP